MYNKISGCLTAAAVLLLILPLFLRWDILLAQQEDPVIQALTDEMKRTLDQLKLEGEKPPYFISYLVNLEDNCQITAEYGAVVNCNCDRGNQAFLDLRVGGPDFDNSNFMAGFRGLGLYTINLPDEISYTAIRKSAWLNNDAAYKAAVERLAQKRAVWQSLVPDDTIPDLAPAEQTIKIDPLLEAQVDTALWKQKLEKLSSRFAKFPQFKRSSVQLHTKTENRYIINSEGTLVRQGRHVHYLLIEARAQDQNGLPVYQYDRLVVDDINDFPEDKKLEQWVDSFLTAGAAMIAAEIIDDYIGPVLFTPRASGQMFSALFIENISNPRKPLLPDSRFDSYLPNPRLVRKLGFRVLPEFLNIIDDPTTGVYAGQKLLGSYAIDDNGVPAQKISLVENGKLKNYYMSRTPTKKIARSNGHGRLIQGGIGNVDIVGKPGNVIVQATETYSFEKLKEQLLELCRSLDLEYGLIVDKMDFSGMPDPDGSAGYSGGRGESLLPKVISGYRISVKDGSVTPVRSLEFVNVNERALKDILAVGNDFEVTTLMFDRAFNNLTSVVIPSILIEEMELKKTSESPRKPPVAQSPLQRP